MKGNVTDNNLMTVRQMMAYLGVSKKTAYRLINDEMIPSYRISPRKRLVKKTEVEAYIEKCKY